MVLPESMPEQQNECQVAAYSWARPVTAEDILDRIDQSAINELVFTVRVWDRDTRAYRQEPQLTQAGAVTVARVMGGISTGQPVWTFSEDEVSCDVSATDHVTGLTVWGTSSAPLMITYNDSKSGEEVTRRNEHARATALGKAQRNALAHLVPIDVEQALFRWHREQSAGQTRQRSNPNSQPIPRTDRPQRERRRREDYVPLLQECGDSSTLAATWKDVRTDGYEADSELMQIAFRLCKEFIGDTYTAKQWNQVKSDIYTIGFLTDPEIGAALDARKQEIRQAGGTS